MPGMTLPGCFDLGTYAMKQGASVERSMKYASHFDKCDASNVYDDSFLRHFFTTIHCACWCHRAHLTDEQAQARRHAFNWWVARLYLVTILLPAIIAMIVHNT